MELVEGPIGERNLLTMPDHMIPYCYILSMAFMIDLLPDSPSFKLPRPLKVTGRP